MGRVALFYFFVFLLLTSLVSQCKNIGKAALIINFSIEHEIPYRTRNIGGMVEVYINNKFYNSLSISEYNSENLLRINLSSGDYNIKILSDYFINYEKNINILNSSNTQFLNIKLRPEPNNY